MDEEVRHAPRPEHPHLVCDAVVNVQDDNTETHLNSS